MMEIRADLSQTAKVPPEAWEWVASPQAGVERVMLDRVGDEVAVATSFVRYAPDSHFPGHEHALGEEFIVLEGEFGDEHGRYPAGTYVRNPPGSRHVPFSDPGCLIWVKLRQFQTDDLTQMVGALKTRIPASGQARRDLHAHGEERVAEIVAASGEAIVLGAADRPQELLVMEGEVTSEASALGKWGWLRIPAGASLTLMTTAPTRLFWKTRPGGELDEYR
jgi:quercetin dioxygenase-like cupin family protein